MRPLSGLDAAFIYLESSRAPMHIGGLYVLDAADAPRSFGYDAFRRHIESRIPLSRVFRERLIETPLSVTHPYWINDPEFELDFHLPHMAVPRPGGLRELKELAAKIFGRPLNRSRPLWEITFVDGLDEVPGVSPGSFAVVTKIHHAAVDGGSGAELMGALLDTTEKPRKIDVKDTWEPESLPGLGKMIGGAYGRLLPKSLELGKLVAEVGGGLGRLYGMKRTVPLKSPPRLMSAPRTLFNAKVSPHRTFWGVNIDFERFRNVKAALPEVTVNDVVLSICAGGLRKYLLSRDALPADPLVAMAPVSVRRKEQKGQMGNQVSAMLVDLDTNQEDALRRLLRIHANTLGSKTYSKALPANRIAEFIPSETAALAARLYSMTRLGDRHRPFFNLVITNVPGPPVPLYMAGARIDHTFSTAPILDGLGLIIVIFSYAGRLSITLTSCREIVPDPEQLADYIAESMDELEEDIYQMMHPEGETEDEAEALPPSEVAVKLDTAMDELEQVLIRLRSGGAS